MEHRRFADVADTHEAVDLVRLDARVGECAGGEVGPLLERELARPGVGPFTLVVGDTDDGGVPSKAHTHPPAFERR